jgi:octaprenyl-diphosphate synthase
MTLSARSRADVAAALHDIQAPVHDRLAQVSENLWRIAAADLPLVSQVNAHLLGMKGKMFRPTLVLLASAADDTPEPRALAVAASIEVLHLATLVHDDAVDHSVLRRGMPTVNTLFSHQVSVIMGDYLYARTLAELVRLGDLEIMRVFTRASTEMTLGELRQLGALDALRFSEADYTKLIQAKTASLFQAACEVGALCGATRHREALSHYGQRLGMAFQIADDLLDYTEGQEMTGKPTGLDLREHKVTLPLIAALREMPTSARETVDMLFATSSPEDALVADVISIVGEYGGLEYARRRGEQVAREAEEALATLPESPVRSSLLDAIGYVMDRRW